MADIIQLLPDSIASQIAAGEVIQRPASVVKELVENSIDADANHITIVIKDAGKTLIQVLDNGKGMSTTDARMCFERHATSKIKSANDIFKINTKGFRGEALASIAAIAHVELITRQNSDDVGTKIVIMGSKFKKQETVQSDIGTKISVKNLFFNVPARRKFLKSDVVEFKHITDEFFRLALAHTGISFTLFHNGKELYRLPASGLKQRIVNIFGRGYESKLLPVNEQMDLLKISGFTGKIDSARKSRTHQYIFVNNRYIKSNYLAHAIKAAYEEYIDKDRFPIYFLFLETDPANIDVNIHPTKQEIKFEDERLVYNYIRVVLKRILGKFHYTPSLDFEENTEFDVFKGKKPARYGQEHKFNTSSTFSSKIKKATADDWEKAFEILHDKKDIRQDETIDNNIEIESKLKNKNFNINFDKNDVNNTLFQIKNSYILKEVETGFILIDQYYAHQRVLYEKYLQLFSDKKLSIQQLLFPIELKIEKQDIPVFESLLETFKNFGFDISKDSNDKYSITGVPALLENHTNVNDIIAKVVREYANNRDNSVKLEENIAGTLAKANAKNKGQKLANEEMNYLVDKLFACGNPYKSPFGKKTFIKIEINEIINRFKN